MPQGKSCKRIEKAGACRVKVCRIARDDGEVVNEPDGGDLLVYRMLRVGR